MLAFRKILRSYYSMNGPFAWAVSREESLPKMLHNAGRAGIKVFKSL